MKTGEDGMEIKEVLEIGTHKITVIWADRKTGLVYYCPFYHLNAPEQNWFAWNLDAALIASIQYQNSNFNNGMARVTAMHCIGIRDRDPRDVMERNDIKHLLEK